MIGKGLPVWLPNGEIQNQIEKYAIETENRYGYDRVTTPVLGKKNYSNVADISPTMVEGMYPPMEMMTELTTSRL